MNEDTDAGKHAWHSWTELINNTCKEFPVCLNEPNCNFSDNDLVQPGQQFSDTHIEQYFLNFEVDNVNSKSLSILELGSPTKQPIDWSTPKIKNDLSGAEEQVGAGLGIPESTLDLADISEDDIILDNIEDSCVNLLRNSNEIKGKNLRNRPIKKKCLNISKPRPQKKHKVSVKRIDIKLKGLLKKRDDIILKQKKKIIRPKSTGKNLICDKCKEIFDNASSYYFHRSMHINNTNICSWLCAQCNEEFLTEGHLRTHEISTHGQIRPYPCPYCVNSFLQYLPLQNHIRSIHHKEKPFKCTFCNQNFFKPYDLKMHLNLHFGIKMHMCEECGQYFSHPSNLLRHIRLHTGVKPYVCETCNVRFSHITSLLVHETSHTNGVSCPHCSVKFQTKLGLKKHITKVHSLPVSCSQISEIFKDKNYEQKPRSFYCLVCGKNFIFKNELRLHEIKYHNNPFKCPSCEASIVSIKEFRKHSCSFDRASKHSVSCDDNFINLGKSTVKINNKIESTTIQVIALDQSDNSVNTIELSPLNSSFIIAGCEDSYSEIVQDGLGTPSSKKLIKKINMKKEEKKIKKSLFAEEILNNFNENKQNPKTQIGRNQNKISNVKLKSLKKSNLLIRNFQCSHCPKTFSKKWNLQQHLGIHDASSRMFVCKECDLSFSYRSTYTVHCLSHTDPHKRFQCSQCPKNYKTKDSRYQHEQRFHAKKCKYFCLPCNKGFFDKAEHAYHIRMHKKECPYVCSTCDKKFSHISHLHRHQRIHTGERPHKCPHCSQAFIQPVTLKNHLKKHASSIGQCLIAVEPPSATSSNFDSLKSSEEISSICVVKENFPNYVNATDPSLSTLFNSEIKDSSISTSFSSASIDSSISALLSFPSIEHSKTISVSHDSHMSIDEFIANCL